MVGTGDSAFAPGRQTATKFIETGFFVEVYECEDVFSGREDRDSDETPEDDDAESKGKSVKEIYDAKSRRIQHYQAERHRIRRIIECNACGGDARNPEQFADKFFTLTFAENVTDERYANKELGKFFKRLKRWLERNHPGTELKYLACIERQKRGAVHYHCVLFSFPFVRNDVLQEMWGHGFTDIEAIRSLDDVGNVGLYISKYFTKDIDHDYKRKKWFRSQNLKEPVELRTVTEGVDFGGMDVALSYEYERWVRDVRTGDYKVSKVRYTKVRNDGRGIAAFVKPPSPNGAR